MAFFSSNCPGPVYEDTGVRICRLDPEMDNPDCDNCWAEMARQIYDELRGDCDRDEEGWAR